MNQRRHNSLMQPQYTMTISSPIKRFQNFNSNHTLSGTPKMNIHSNSIFAFQEFDQFSNFLEGIESNNNNPQKTQNQNAKIENDLQSSSNDSSSSDSIEEHIPYEQSFQPNFKKRKSANLLHPFTFEDLIKHSNSIAQIPQGILVGQNNKNKIKEDINFFRNNNSNHNYTQFQSNNRINSFYNQRKSFDFSNQNCFPLQRVNSQCHHLSIDDKFILDNICPFIFDQSRSRQIQDMIEEKKDDVFFIRLLYDKIKTNLYEIINHNLGNYVIQKVFAVFLYQKNKELITDFFTRIKDELYDISINKYGSILFQKVLELLEKNYKSFETETLNQIIKNFIEKYLFDLCREEHGNYVVQKIIKAFPKNKNNFIYGNITKNIFDISKLQQGALIIKKAIQYGNQEQNGEMIKNILNSLSLLINDEYGNYIIQLIINLNDKGYNEIIYKNISDNIIQLAKRKYSSHVIEKFISLNSEASVKLVNYIIDNKMVKEIIQDQYGNYVIQKALEVSQRDNVFIKLIQVS